MRGRTRLTLTIIAAVVAVVSWSIVALRPRAHPVAVAWHQEPLPPSVLYAALDTVQTPLGKPAPGEWLFEHPEPGQTFEQYRADEPVRVTPSRRTVYLQPIGEFTQAQQRVLAQTANFLERFYQLPVKTLPTLASSVIPEQARRLNPMSQQPQWLTTFILHDVLTPRRPNDAVALMALTAEDLYPSPDWNFVFGEASLSERVGVWSLARNGDLATEPDRFLLRTLQTATHELGHMLSLEHCTAWKCVMNGSNSLEESDRQPLEVCPVCLRKLAWNIGFDPGARLESLAAFSSASGLSAQTVEFSERLVAWRRGLMLEPFVRPAATVQLPIPDRQWDDDAPESGWCGEASIQMTGLHFGAWLPQRFVNASGSPTHEDLWEENLDLALSRVGLRFERWQGPHGNRRATPPEFLEWIISHLRAGQPVIIGSKLLPTEHPDWDVDHLTVVVGATPTGLIIDTNMEPGQTEVSYFDLFGTRGISFVNPTGAFTALAVQGFGDGPPVRAHVLSEDGGSVELLVSVAPDAGAVAVEQRGFDGGVSSAQPLGDGGWRAVVPRHQPVRFVAVPAR